MAYSLCYPGELEMLRDIEQLTRCTLIAVEDDPYYPPGFSPELAAAQRARKSPRKDGAGYSSAPALQPETESICAPNPETRYGRRPVRRLSR